MMIKRLYDTDHSRVASVRSTSMTCDVDVLLAHEVSMVKTENLTGCPKISTVVCPQICHPSGKYSL